MKFKCEIDNLKTLKKGMKITLAIDDENTISVMKDIYITLWINRWRWSYSLIAQRKWKD